MSGIDRNIPCDINAETAVLSAMMIDNESLVQGLSIMNERHFYKTAHKAIFKCMSELFNENVEVDIITLLNKLETKKELDTIGGRAYVNELSDVVLSPANMSYHARLVIEKSMLRDLLHSVNSIAKSILDNEGSAEDIIDSAEQTIFQIANSSHKTPLASVSSIVPEIMEKIDYAIKHRVEIKGISTGYVELDSKIGGLKKGQLIILASRPAMGKSSLAMNIASNVALDYKKIAVFTLEMTSVELMTRTISSLSDIPIKRIVKGFQLREEELHILSHIAHSIAKSELYIDDNGYVTIMDVRAKARRLKSELRGLDLIIIDYLQLMSTANNRKTENRQQEISNISRALKILAKELDVPIIALSQLSRALESRSDKRPILSDLRESGAIEQDADVVLFIYRDEYYNENSMYKGGAELIIGKNRNGEVGKVYLDFDNETTRFRCKGFMV